MFEAAELGRATSKQDYDKLEPKLRTEVLALQAQARDAKIATFILVNGVNGAGKGEAVNTLYEWMDPRYLRTFTFEPDRTDDELARPDYWRYWTKLTPRGVVGIYFGNWYTDPIVGRVNKTMRKGDFEVALTRINAFERALTDDGAVLVKLWFHLSKKEQKKKFAELLDDKRTRWRVTKQDLADHERYSKFRNVSERALRETSTGYAPWIIVESNDKRFRNITMGEAVRAAWKSRLSMPAPAAPKKSPTPKALEKTVLDTLDLDQKVDDDKYDDDLEKSQGKLNRAFKKLKNEDRSVIAVFEGWDAAGKGGAIRRITASLDARDYTVIPVAAPTDEERAHHYLWRFWRHLPGRGKMTIYDRSWYGRVLVERVEGFARVDEWQRAYAEINEMEEQFVESGIVVAKFWLHIDPAEQMKRFKERQKTEFKRFKITEEDWRNREKTPQYVDAVHEMVQRTSTEIAPWHLVAANDKRFARLDVLKHLVSRIEKAL
jgi:AMP-polyphosphate phosphotransferase